MMEQLMAGEPGSGGSSPLPRACRSTRSSASSRRIVSCSSRVRSPPLPRQRALPGPSQTTPTPSPPSTALPPAWTAQASSRRSPARGVSRSSATRAASPAMRRCVPSAAARWRAPSSPATPSMPGVCSPFSSQAAPALSSASTSRRRAASATGSPRRGSPTVGGGIAMIRGRGSDRCSEFQSFALAAQALG